MVRPSIKILEIVEMVALSGWMIAASGTFCQGKIEGDL
jgi:hypothetical protein